MKKFLTILVLMLLSSLYGKNKPKVWIYSDTSDKTLPGNNHMGTINDPDDISAMAGYMLMMNEFETLGIVVASTHRKEHKTTPNQGDWANKYYGNAYRAEVDNLNRNIGGYPKDIHFYQSCIKESAERFSFEKEYKELNKYSTVQLLFDACNKTTDTINVLCWGSLTEPAILVKHCLSTGREDILKKLRFIAHWTNSPLHQGSIEHPEDVANCREDADACAYLKDVALQGKIKYYELGAIGQHGIVGAGGSGENYFNKFKVSRIGKIFAEGKFVYGSVDHSDSATYWTLLGSFGVSLNDVNSNGTNSIEIEKKNENKFRNNSLKIHNELLRRAKAAALNN